ncbi:MAG: rhodanese-like domain-containing protein [Erysipelotrichaceae bacterium]
MKLLVLSCLLVLVMGCTSKDVVIYGVVVEQRGQSLLIESADVVGFDRASVQLPTSETTFDTKDVVRIVYDGMVRESYPVQLTAKTVEKAVDLTLKSEPHTIDALLALTLMQTMDVTILDVRSEAEFNQGHIADAISLPLDQISQQTMSDTAKDAIVLVYCKSGNRSKQAVELLDSLGYEHVLDFGGVNDWPFGLVENEVT